MKQSITLVLGFLFSISVGFVIGCIFCVSVGFTIYKVQPQYFIKISNPKPHLRKLTAEEISFYKSQYVTIKAGRNTGSGCIARPGIVVTAFHVVMPAFLEKRAIYVNDKPAKVLAYTSMETDMVFLTTNDSKDKKLAALPEYDFKIGEDFVTVGSPGEENSLVESGVIINDHITDENGMMTTTKKVSSIYIESGLSGGCVYPVGWDIPVAITTKKENDPNHKIGYISLASKIIEEEPEK